MFVCVVKQCCLKLTLCDETCLSVKCWFLLCLVIFLSPVLPDRFCRERCIEPFTTGEFMALLAIVFFTSISGFVCRFKLDKENVVPGAALGHPDEEAGWLRQAKRMSIDDIANTLREKNNTIERLAGLKAAYDRRIEACEKECEGLLGFLVFRRVLVCVCVCVCVCMCVCVCVCVCACAKSICLNFLLPYANKWCWFGSSCGDPTVKSSTTKYHKTL